MEWQTAPSPLSHTLKLLPLFPYPINTPAKPDMLKSLNKVESLQKRSLRFYVMTTVVHTKNYLKSQEKAP